MELLWERNQKGPEVAWAGRGGSPCPGGVSLPLSPLLSPAEHCMRCQRPLPGVPRPSLSWFKAIS